MARKIRIFLEDVPQLIILKSINKENVFQDEKDFETYLQMLKEQSIKNSCEIHSYVLMPKYILILTTPKLPNSISSLMQTQGRRYVGYFNQKYNRSGTLWEGRFKSAIVDVANYFFAAMRYVEQSPIRESLVENAQEYKYSSAMANATTKQDGITKHHILYNKLARDLNSCAKAYETILEIPVSEEVLNEIELNLHKQTILGSPVFREKIEQIYGQVLKARDRGRPSARNLQIVQWNKKERLMFAKVEALDKEKHSKVKIISKQSLSFAKTLNVVPAVASEVYDISKEYPLVFTDSVNPTLVVLVSIGNSGNLAINNDGKWVGEYVPAYLNNYPLSTISTEDKNTKIVVIDPESELLNEKEGEALFDENQESSQFLKNYIQALDNYDSQAVLTAQVAKEFEDNNILENREVSVGEGDSKIVLVKGFKVINQKKLNSLDDKILASWVRKGYMAMIDAHIRSLVHINTLVERSEIFNEEE